MSAASSYSICRDLGRVLPGGISHSRASESAFSRDPASQDREANIVSTPRTLGRMKLPTNSLGRSCYAIGRGAK